MESLFDRIFRRLEAAIVTGRAEPLPMDSPVAAIRPVAATGLFGGPTVQDLESQQVEFGRGRAGNVGGWTYNAIADRMAAMPEPGSAAVQLSRQTEPSRSPGFLDGPIIGGYSAPQPRSPQGANPYDVDINRGGFDSPDAYISQV